MAVNKDPFVRTLSADGKARKFRGLVQAGSSQAIKRGEICAYNKTAGYWDVIDATTDIMYALAIAAEEQKAADSARYMEFYALHPNDQFEFAIDAARQLYIGDRFILTAADTQALTYSATACPVARCVDDQNVPWLPGPAGGGTTLGYRSYAVVSFDIGVSAWGRLISGEGLGKPVAVQVTTAQTLYPEQSGLILITTPGSNTTGHVLPANAPEGTWYRAMAMAAYDVGFDPATNGAIYVEGAKQTDNREVTVDAIGDTITVINVGSNDWLAECSISSAADQTGAIDVAGS